MQDIKRKMDNKTANVGLDPARHSVAAAPADFSSDAAQDQARFFKSTDCPWDLLSREGGTGQTHLLPSYSPVPSNDTRLAFSQSQDI